ncbi:LytTR family DNA-binding domain-containing protein [Fulvivirga ulvae]|uniref:LytR/AlgR family response regulator transcription factor n=1 Tax=Fulvivirga ulvae TaxID=2904245 RepID=UPI001F350379|nr:LytTR family DNA-binding domain-containing protein [Fulvivirga ulvae]UII30116.1 LytTR family DNA-binding domain-containing protein [Fulvivirga ulvae]
MKKISAVVVDDDAIFQTIVNGFIGKTDSVELKQAFSNPIDAINYLMENKVDLIFLDVEMPQMSGLEFISSLDYNPQIILITSNEAYAVEAFEHQVADYLLKPLDNYSRFLRAVNKVREAVKELSEEDHFFIKEDNKLVKIHFADINYIEAYGDYVKIYTDDKCHITLSTLKSISKKLSGADFIQTHRSYLVRLDKIDSIEGNTLNINKYNVPFSKSMREEILEKIVK